MTLATVPAEPQRLHPAQLAGVAGAAILAGTAGIVAYTAEPGRSSFVPPCLIHELTGIYCPGCGATRSLHSLLHGDVLSAFTYNPLFSLTLPVLAWLLFRYARHAVRRNTSTSWFPRVGGRAAWTIAGVVLAFFVLRNVPVEPFSFLAPHPWA